MQIVIDTNRLEQIREARRLSLAALADKSKVTERQLQRILRCEGKTIRANTLKALAKALRVEEDFLLGKAELPEEIHNPSEQSRSKLSGYTIETRLVKLEDEFVIVEFTSHSPTGTIIARGIKDEASGLMLSQVGELKKKLQELLIIASDPRGVEETFEEFVDHSKKKWEGELADIFNEYIGEIDDLLKSHLPSGNQMDTDVTNIHTTDKEWRIKDSNKSPLDVADNEKGE